MMKQIIVVAGIISKEGSILLLQRHENEKIFPGMWELPSGKKNIPEKTSEALIREIKEETGLEKIKIIKPLSVFDYIIKKKDETRYSTQINFLIKTTKNCAVKISKEHQNFLWIKESDLKKINISLETRRSLEIAYKEIKKAK